MSEADFPKDEETVPVSERACTRLVGVLGALGVDPDVPVNPVDAAAFILEGMLDALQQLNNTTDVEPGRVREAVIGLMRDMPLPPPGPGVLTGDGFVNEPTDDELDELDTETHESGCAIWDNQEEVDSVCTCGLENA